MLDIRTLMIKTGDVSKPKDGPTLTYLIKWMERKVRSELETALEPLGITLPEYTALSVLKAGRELSSAQLARRTFVSAQAMHPIVVALERKQLVIRRNDPGHGRIHLVRMSEQGKAQLSACDAACKQAEVKAFHGLARAEIESLRISLERCVLSIDPS